MSKIDIYKRMGYDTVMMDTLFPNKEWVTTKQAMIELGITLSQFRTIRRKHNLKPYRPSIPLKNELGVGKRGNVLVWKRKDIEALKNGVKAVPVE